MRVGGMSVHSGKVSKHPLMRFMDKMGKWEAIVLCVSGGN